MFKHKLNKIILKVLSFLLLGFSTNLAFADYPRPDQIWFQEPATPVMEELLKFNEHMFWIVGTILVLVCLVLAYTCIRFSAKNNPIPSKTTHNVKLEIIWTLIPSLIVAYMAFPSIKVLKYADVSPEAEINLKVIAHQWYWEYNYPDHGNFSYMSYMIPKEQIKPGDKYLLEVDNRVVVPVGANVKVLITSGDVIHSWAIPSFGVKTDAVPGRTNEAWFNVTKPGVYYGQCSELCGINHAFMPIVVEAKSKEDFEKWVHEAKTKYSEIQQDKNKLVLIK